MSVFYDNSITDVGRLLLADIQSGAKFVPTKIVIGSGYMPQGKTTRTMTDVAEIVKELSLNKVQKTSDGSVIFGTSFNNEDIFEPFYYRELGLYAKGVYYNDDGEPSNETEEVLYSYGNAGDNAELIPAYSEGSITERQLDLIVYIGNDTEVVVNIESGMYVTMPVFTEQIEKINKEIITIKADFDGINDKIGITTDDEGTVSTGTVFGKLNSILLYLTVTLVEKLSKITEDISENKTSIGSAEDLSTSPTIFGKLAEIKETLTTKFNEVISKITDSISENKKVVGSPEDISTSPTIFGKLAEIKEIITSKFADIISKITGIDSKIGTTTDTGGTSSAGGIFAKLNKLLTDWTTTRASRIDSIYTNTTTNNTANTTGTLSQKLSSVISTLSSILTNTNASTTSSSTGTLSQKLNYVINNMVTKDFFLGEAIEFTSPGTYTITIPTFAKSMIVTACGGGGGGGSGTSNALSGIGGGAGGGGGGAAAINNKTYSLTGKGGTEIKITIGAGGAGGNRDSQNGVTGESTIISGFVTLAGGIGGRGDGGDGGASGGAGGGRGGAGAKSSTLNGYTGTSGVVGTGGTGGTATEQNTHGGGGGGGSLGAGGKGDGYTSTGTEGSKGSGGGGGKGSYRSSYSEGKKGGDGYCKIEWIG